MFISFKSPIFKSISNEEATSAGAAASAAAAAAAIAARATMFAFGPMEFRIKKGWKGRDGNWGPRAGTVHSPMDDPEVSGCDQS